VTYDFKRFPYTDTVISLPENTVFYRGFQAPPHDVLRPNVPIYIAPYGIASQYGKIVYELHTTRVLRMLDLRKIMAMMPTILRGRNINDASDQQVLKLLSFVTMAFGLVSYGRQTQLLQQHLLDNMDPSNPEGSNFFRARLANMQSFDLSATPLNASEPEGVRVGETVIDGHVMLVVKELFAEVCDGYIAAKCFSPFHVGNFTHEEVVVFDPTSLRVAEPTPMLTPVPITVLLRPDVIHLRYMNIIDRPVVMQRGGGGTRGVEDKNKFFDCPDRVAAAQKLVRAFIEDLRRPSRPSRRRRSRKQPTQAGGAAPSSCLAKPTLAITPEGDARTLLAIRASIAKMKRGGLPDAALLGDY
jgi:hypothetical protein